MKRREFARGASAMAAACLAPRLIFAGNGGGPISATLTIDDSAKLATVPPDFIGLSYESAQLATPAFFAAENTALVALFRELSGQGVLRLGGGTSDFTVFTTEEPKGPAPFDIVGPDTSKNVKADTPVTPKSLKNLCGFLDATGWRCLYGLNLARGTAAEMAEEARSAQSILGPRLIAFQLGNEPDAWRNRYRPATWSYEDYWKEWLVAQNAVREQVPEAKLAGPDVSNKMAYVTGFAADVKQNAPDVTMITSHYYAMGPAGAADVNMEKLLAPDPKLERDLKTAVDAAREAGLTYRMTEGNSCWNGGEPGVSDTLASALWVVDMMLAFAAGGCAGVNLHGGGNGYYTPIAGSIADGFARRPEYFGMEMAKEFLGATIVRTALECESDRVRAYAAVKDGRVTVVAINKTNSPVMLRMPVRDVHEQWTLTGEALDAKDGVALTKTKTAKPRNGVLAVAVHSAILVRT
jgi:hypothetical protein